MPAYTPDNIALGIIAEGRRIRSGEGQRDHPAISDKGIKIAIATGLVESNLKMYANNRDPASLRFPHDAVGSDANSVGVFQQRAEWWGTIEDRMDVARSAALFYNSLHRQRIGDRDYNTDAVSPGRWAQMVQQSAFPDRYDQRWADATRIFNTLQDEALPPGGTPPAPPAALRPQFTELEMWGTGSSSRSRPPINFLLHTQEGSWDATAEDLAAFCQGQNNVSYHYTIRDRIVYDVVDTDRYSWSVLSANTFTINLCFAGSSVRQTRQQWLDRYGPDLDIAAYLAVQDCRKYSFSTEVIKPPYHEAPGISDHKYVTEQLHIGDHTDVGPNFPWDVFEQSVRKYVTGEGGGDPVLEMLSMPNNQEKLDWLYAEQRNAVSMYATGPNQETSQAEAYGWDGRVESSAERGEAWAIDLVSKAAEGTLYGVQRIGGPDPFLVEHAIAVLRSIDVDKLVTWREGR
jgi:N-acetyl-anhydromuramyl-L-alanine amidase AmpD